MKKFSKINESVNLGKFQISSDEFAQYKNTINRILTVEMYPDMLKSVGSMKLVKALPYEENGRDFSVLNKVNTNIRLMSAIVSTFAINNFKDLLAFVSDNRNDLFTDGGKYFRSLVYTTIRSTEKIGEENEELVANYIKNLAKDKYGIDIRPVREVTSSENDMIRGIDITFDILGKAYTCQVKPLISYREDGDNFIITSSGLIKQYSTDYIAFANIPRKEVMMFQNKNIGIDGNIITIKNLYLVKYDVESTFNNLNSKNMKKLNKNQIDLLVDMPEQGMGYQVVDIEMKNGEIIQNKKILNSTYIQDGEDIDPNDIKSISLSK